jgi:hypothetical protein
MAEILTLRQVFLKDGMKFVNKLFDQFVVVSEKLNATRFCFERTEKGIIFYKRDGQITSIDRTMSGLYESPIRYIQSLPKEDIEKLPIGFRYGFRYFHTTKPANITYDKIPLNGLVLTDIKSPKGKIIDDVSILNGISDLLRVEKPPIIWYGKLDQSQKTRLLEYLRTPEDELIKRFSTNSFTKYIISILNPELKTTALKDDIEKPVDSIIFKFISEDETETVHSKVIDPVITQINRSTDEEREPQDLYGIILSDLVEYIKVTGLQKYGLKTFGEEDRYIELICQIFQQYIKRNGYKYEGIEVDPLSFASVPEFDLNTGFIEDKKVRDLIKASTINKHIFKILMSSFNKPKKKPSGTVTQMLIDDVQEIATKIKEKLKDVKIGEASSFPTFEDYYKKKIEEERKIKL